MMILTKGYPTLEQEKSDMSLILNKEVILSFPDSRRYLIFYINLNSKIKLEDAARKLAVMILPVILNQPSVSLTFLLFII